jgi:putative SbcD/Mre11-related phosphoesterase
VQDIQYRDRSIVLNSGSILVLSDLHIGRDEASNVEFPLGEQSDLVDRVDMHLTTVAPEEVVLAGDIFHEFGRLTARSRSTIDALEDRCHAHGATLTCIQGNHDNMLTEWWTGNAHESYIIEDSQTVVCHGHEIPSVGARRYIIGHEHPTIRIEGTRHPCFLEIQCNESDVLVLPAFSRLSPGVVVNRMSKDAFQSPLLEDIDSITPLIFDSSSEDILEFPPLAELTEYL